MTTSTEGRRVLSTPRRRRRRGIGFRFFRCWHFRRPATSCALFSTNASLPAAASSSSRVSGRSADFARPFKTSRCPFHKHFTSGTYGRSKISYWPRNSNWRGRFSTVDLLIKVACFVWKRVNNVGNINSSGSKPVCTRRSTVLIFPL